MIPQKVIDVRERRSPRLSRKKIQAHESDSIGRRSLRLSAKSDKKGVKRKADVQRKRKRKRKKKLWEVEKIMSQRRVKKKTGFEVKWVGYEETTWEPKSSLVDCDFLLQEFKAQTS